MNPVIGVVAGGLDTYLERNDAGAGRTVGKAWSTWARIIGTGLGFAGQAFGYWPYRAAALAQSEITLLTKTAYEMVAPAGGGGGAGARPRGRARVRETVKPGFENVEVY